MPSFVSLLTDKPADVLRAAARRHRAPDARPLERQLSFPRSAPTCSPPRTTSTHSARTRWLRARRHPRRRRHEPRLRPRSCRPAIVPKRRSLRSIPRSPSHSIRTAMTTRPPLTDETDTARIAKLTRANADAQRHLGEALRLLAAGRYAAYAAALLNFTRIIDGSRRALAGSVSFHHAKR